MLTLAMSLAGSVCRHRTQHHGPGCVGLGLSLAHVTLLASVLRCQSLPEQPAGRRFLRGVWPSGGTWHKGGKKVRKA